MRLIDTHCHFDEARFDPDRASVYRRARQAGVAAQVVPAINAAAWPKVQQVTAAFPDLYPAYGLHPLDLDEHRPEHLTELAHWLDHEPAVAVGECGLDYFVPGLDPDRQADLFTAQLRLARAHDLPVIVHARRSVDHVIKYLRRYPGLRGVVHSFSGSEDQAHRLLDLGFLFGFGGPLTYPRAQRLRRLVQVLPLDALLLETDAPFQPGLEQQGGRNEPGFLPAVLAVAAAVRGEDPAVLAAATTRNALALFRLAL